MSYTNDGEEAAESGSAETGGLDPSTEHPPASSPPVEDPVVDPDADDDGVVRDTVETEQVEGYTGVPPTSQPTSVADPGEDEAGDPVEHHHDDETEDGV